jgi:hypothetical protein
MSFLLIPYIWFLSISVPPSTPLAQGHLLHQHLPSTAPVHRYSQQHRFISSPTIVVDYSSTDNPQAQQRKKLGQEL